MAVDTVLVKALLEVLAVLGDRGRTQSALAAECELRMDSNTTIQQVEQMLAFCKQQGWADEREDIFGEPRWYITDAGLNRQAQM